MEAQQTTAQFERRWWPDRRLQAYDSSQSTENRRIERRQARATSPRSARLSLDEITDAAQRIARELDPSLVVLGLVGGRARSNYVEILLGMTECGVEPCRITLGVDRASSIEDLRRALQQPIREYLGRRQSEWPH